MASEVFLTYGTVVEVVVIGFRFWKSGPVLTGMNLAGLAGNFLWQRKFSFQTVFSGSGAGTNGGLATHD